MVHLDLKIQLLSQLFDRYKQGFVEYCPHSIANCYRIPCAVADGDGVNVYDSDEALLKKFDKNCNVLKQQDLRNVDYRVNNVTEISNNAIAVDIEWSISLGHTNVSFSGHYVCQKIDDNWRIFSAQL